MRKLTPVTLAPGRLRRDKAELDGIAANSDQDWNRRGARLGGDCGRNSAYSGNQVDLALYQFGRERRQSIIMQLGPAILEGDVAPFGVTTFG